jgi:hypothetical protein
MIPKFANIAKIVLPRIVFSSAIAIILFPLVIYSGLLLRRPPRTAQQKQLFPGITYQRIADLNPRPVMMHIVTIDLNTPGIKLRVTPGEPGDDGKDIPAQTTSEFLQKHQLQLAINGSFFYPCYFNHFWDFVPQRGDRVNVIGQLISGGILYKEGKPDWGVLCVSESAGVSIAPAHCPPNTREAIAGREIIIQNGQPVAIPKPENNSDRHKPYPRTVVATDPLGEKLWFILVDGRQPHYSQGLTLPEVTEILLKMGVDTALNLDGGGSTTLAIAEGKNTRLLNSPIDARIPMRERAIANHIGIYALPQSSHQKP